MTMPCTCQTNKMKKDSMDAKCSAANVDPAVARQLLASLDYDRLRREAKESTVMTLGKASVTVRYGTDYFFDSREALRKRRPGDLAWAF